MTENGNSPAPDARIHIDNMNLTVSNIYPVFRKRSEQEVRLEISDRLYQIFKKYV